MKVFYLICDYNKHILGIKNLTFFEDKLTTLTTTITRLNLSKCTQITDESSKYFQYFTNLQQLTLGGCKLISNKILKFIPNNIQQLRIGNCPNITDEGNSF